MTHELKTWVEFFDDVLFLRKIFEVRKNDRNFQVGDKLLLREWDNINSEYTGHKCLREVSYFLTGTEWGISEGYCVLGIKEV